MCVRYEVPPHLDRFLGKLEHERGVAPVAGLRVEVEDGRPALVLVGRAAVLGLRDRRPARGRPTA